MSPPPILLLHIFRITLDLSAIFNKRGKKDAFLIKERSGPKVALENNGQGTE